MDQEPSTGSAVGPAVAPLVDGAPVGGALVYDGAARDALGWALEQDTRATAATTNGGSTRRHETVVTSEEDGTRALRS